MEVAVIVTLTLEGDWQTLEEATNELKDLDDAELWAVAKAIEYSYELPK